MKIDIGDREEKQHYSLVSLSWKEIISRVIADIESQISLGVV